jgi:hypothetical protein
MALDALAKRINSWVDIGNGLFARRVFIDNPGVEMAAIQDYDRFTITASVDPVDTWDISAFDEVALSVYSAAGTDTVQVLVSVDGVNFENVSPSGRDASTGSTVSCAALINKKVTIPFNGKKLRFVASAANDTIIISWSARNSGRVAV